MTSEIDFTALFRLGEQGLAESRALRAGLRDQRTLLLSLTEGLRRLERRQSELRDDLELMIRGC